MIPFSRELWIEQDDFAEVPPPKFFRLKPGGEVRLKYAYIIKCDEVIKDPTGKVVELRCTADLDSKTGGATSSRKIKGTIHWVSAAHAIDAECRLYDRLFTAAEPDADGDFKKNINPHSLEVITAKCEPSLKDAKPELRYQFERLAYFALDSDSQPGKLVFNRTITLKDTWAKVEKKASEDVVVNKHGLKRYIPEEVAREVRQRCGFGCVECGETIVQYEHFSPPFEDATKHDPRGITLLCGLHHDYATKGRLTKQQIAKFDANPFCKNEGFTRFKMYPDVDLEITFGCCTFRRIPVVIQIHDTPLVVIEPPEVPGAPVRLSAIFQDNEGRTTLRIKRNVLESPINNWDIKTTGHQIQICKAKGEIALELEVNPPNNVTITRLEMTYEGASVVVLRDSSFVLKSANGRSATFGQGPRGGHFIVQNFPAGILIGKDGALSVGNLNAQSV